jgi:hypothetical protein
MVLLVLGKQLHRACCRGGFNMPIRQGDDKNGPFNTPCKAILCLHGLQEGACCFLDDWPAAGVDGWWIG